MKGLLLDWQIPRPSLEQIPPALQTDSGRPLPSLAVDEASSSLNILPIPFDFPRSHDASLHQLLPNRCRHVFPTGGITVPAVLCGIVLLGAESPPLVGHITPPSLLDARVKKFLCALKTDVRRTKRSLAPRLPGRFVLRIAFVNRLHIHTYNSRIGAISTKQIQRRRVPVLCRTARRLE